VRRFRGLDHGDGAGVAVPVIILEQDASSTKSPATSEPPVALAMGPNGNGDQSDEILPGFDDVLPTAAPITESLPVAPPWPTLAWEHTLLSTLEHPALPGVIARFSEQGMDYLVEEAPVGRSLWDAWDDPESDSSQRFAWLVDIAQALHQLHQSGAMLE